jgi:hypothetical protein
MCIEMSCNDTILDLKRQIAIRTSFHTCQQLLFYQSIALEDENAHLSTYHIPRDAVLTLTLTPLSSNLDDLIMPIKEETAGFDDSLFFHRETVK